MSNTKNDLEFEIDKFTENTEQQLLDFIDIKYFKNNPEYIEKWQNYFYSHESDIRILFLMKYKKVSTEYHWIYLEMAKFFSKKDRFGISRYILEDALKNGVYDPQVLKKELDSYKNIKTVSPSEAYRYLNPTGFTALGKIWNELKIETFYDQNIYKRDISFEEYRLITYKPKPLILRNQIVVKHKLEFDDNLKRERFSNFLDQVEINKGISIKSGYCQPEIALPENKVIEKEVIDSKLIDLNLKELNCDSRELSVDTQKLKNDLSEIDDFTNINCSHEVKDDTKENSINLQDTRELNLNGKDDAQEFENTNLKSQENTSNFKFNIANDNHQVEYIYSTQDIDLHTIYLSKESDFLISLKEVLCGSPDLVKLYFIKKAFELAIFLNLDIESLDVFYVNTDFEIKFHKMDLTNQKLNLSNLFDIFSEFIEPGVGLEELFENIEGILNTQDLKRVMYKYQIYVYENLK